MAEPNFTVLYVTDVSASTKFYTDLLARPPVEASPGFALFALKSGMMLGLWNGRRGVSASFWHQPRWILALPFSHATRMGIGCGSSPSHESGLDRRGLRRSCRFGRGGRLHAGLPRQGSAAAPHASRGLCRLLFPYRIIRSSPITTSLHRHRRYSGF